MKPSRIVTIIGGLFIIAAAWLPWKFVQGAWENGFRGDNGGKPGILFILLGAVSVLLTVVGKLWSYVIAILCGVASMGLGFMYYRDATSFRTTAGTGTWLMIAGGLLVVVGGVKSIQRRRPAAQYRKL